LAAIEPGGPVAAAAFGPLGDEVVTVSASGVVQWWDPDNTTVKRSVTLDEADGEQLAALTSDAALVARTLGPEHR
ncbi:MAG: hypothetical protein GTN96_07315, partial [Gammaproteobacteria bacterium]|nr:hypothetical protein [Gammaproteobacteria bacterium]